MVPGKVPPVAAPQDPEPGGPEEGGRVRGYRLLVLRANTLFFIIPGKPEYELEPYQGLEFKMKNIGGFTIEFVLDPSDKDRVVELISRQPDGVFRFGRKD